MPQTSPNNDQSQLDKFKQAARELECDDDDKRFKDGLGKLAKAPPAKAGVSGQPN